MSDEATQPQPEESIVEPTAVADLHGTLPDDPENEPTVEMVQVVEAAVVEEALVEVEAAPVQEEVHPSPQPEPVVPQPEPFKLRAGVNCVVDGGQVKPI